MTMTDTLLQMTRYDGPEGTTPCLIVHGLFGSARNWNAIAKRLSASRPVTTVDMRNHGHSFWDKSHGYLDLAGDLERVCTTLRTGPVDVVGHSMGGKACMALALTAPDCIRRLVVADIAPVAYGHSQIQFIEAMQAVDLSQIARRADAAAQLAAQGVEPALQAFFTQSLDLSAGKWRLNLEALAANMPGILGFPVFDSQFDGPTLFLSGATSDYVRPEYRDTIKALFPRARFAKIPGAGHWLHADKPREFTATVQAYLSA